MQPLTASVERGVITLMKEKGGEGQGWWGGGTSTHLCHSLRSWCVLFVFLSEEVADQPALGPAREERFAMVVAHLLANRQHRTISHRLHTEKRDYTHVKIPHLYISFRQLQSHLNHLGTTMPQQITTATTDQHAQHCKPTCWQKASK